MNFENIIEWSKRNLTLLLVIALALIGVYFVTGIESDLDKRLTSNYLAIENINADTTLSKREKIALSEVYYSDNTEIRKEQNQASTFDLLTRWLMALGCLVIGCILTKFTFTKIKFESDTILGRIVIGLAILTGLIFMPGKAFGYHNYSKVAVGSVIFHEGYEAKQYDDVVSVKTWGFGSTRNYKQGFTVDDAKAQMLKDLSLFSKYIYKTVRRPLNQNQIDALHDFTYNLGENIGYNFREALNYGTPGEIKHWMLAYNKAGGKVWQGLVNRRNNNWKLWQGDEDFIHLAMNNYYKYFRKENEL
jgi:lysozyme